MYDMENLPEGIEAKDIVLLERYDRLSKLYAKRAAPLKDKIKAAFGKGNYVVAADLSAHKQRWRSADMSSNAGLLLLEDYLVIGYGFTKEQASLSVLDRKSGAVVQTVPLPKAPDGMRLRGKSLFVRLYDGWAELPWCPQGCGQ